MKRPYNVANIKRSVSSFQRTLGIWIWNNLQVAVTRPNGRFAFP